MKKEFFGILELDYPDLTDEQLRDLQLGKLDKIPGRGGMPLAEYIGKVEALKDSRVAEAAEKRDADLRAMAVGEPIAEPADEADPDIEDEVSDPDEEIGPDDVEFGIE